MSRNRHLIIGSLTTLCATIGGEIIIQWYYVAVIAQQRTQMDMYIQYELLATAGSGDLSLETLNVLNIILIGCGNIVADGLMVRQ